MRVAARSSATAAQPRPVPTVLVTPVTLDVAASAPAPAGLSDLPPTVCGVTENGSTSAAECPADPAPAPRRPALSPSRAADFKLCPLLYRFRAIDRLPELPSPAQLRGTLVHAVLERLYALPAAQRLPAVARELVPVAWAQLCADDPRLPEVVLGDGDSPEAWLDGTGPLLDAYFALEDPRRLEPLARELLVEAELESGLLLRGYVDRIDAIDSDTGPTGQIRVVDYKTGTAPRPVAEVRALFQMKFYAMVLLCLRGVVPTELRLIYITGPEELRYTPDEAELRRFARTLDAIWLAIRTAGATGDFRPNPGPVCAGCSYRALCPAWGGTPPPYPGWPGDAATVDPDDADPEDIAGADLPSGRAAG